MDASPSAQCAPIGSATSRSAVMVRIRGPVGEGRNWFWIERSRRPDSTTKPTLREGRSPAEKRAVAPDLAGQDLAPLRPEVALDGQHDRPLQRDGLGRMCKPHWDQYTTALRKAAVARKAAEDGAGTEAVPAEPEPVEAPEPIRTRDKRGRKAVVPEAGSQGDAG